MYNVKDHLLTRPGLKPAGQQDLNWASLFQSSRILLVRLQTSQPVLKLQNTPGRIANQPPRFKTIEELSKLRKITLAN